LATGTSTKVDTNTYERRDLDPTWSPDGKWLAYTKLLKNHLHAVFVYDVDKGQKHQITDGMSDARSPAFDANGKYLYFTASTDIGPPIGGGEMSAINRIVSRNAYVVVLSSSEPSPLAPESDEEKDEDTSKKDEKAAEKKDSSTVSKDKKTEKPVV